MNVSDQAVVFTCAGDALVGVVSVPARVGEVGVVVVVGGPQYRGGSHRQFVHLARALAAQGVAVMRFDCRGMGDSSGEARDFESTGDDIRAALDTLFATCPQVKRAALWGLCDGASASLLYLDAQADPRVAGLCLLNPWVRSEASLARTQVKHYYLQRLRQPEFWRKLIGGKVAGEALRGLVSNLRLAAGTGEGKPAQQARSFQERMAHALSAFEGPVLIALSDTDYTAREFQEYTEAHPLWQPLLARPRIRREHVMNADHTFSDAASKRAVASLTLQFIESLSAPRGVTAPNVREDTREPV